MKSVLRIVFILVLLGGYVSAADSSWGDSRSQTSPPLDNPLHPIYTLDVGYVMSSYLDGFGSTRMLELDARWRDLYYCRDILYGDIDVGMIFDTTVFAGSADVQLPNQMLRLAVDAGWTWRYMNGDALQVRIAPGLYSDIEEITSDVFFAPVSIIFFKALYTDVGGVVGVQVRPSFERVFFPLVGVDWDINDSMRMSLRLPESQVIVYINSQWSAHLGYEWSSMSYALREKGSYHREMIAYEDSRYTMGVTYKLSDEIQFTGVLGKSFSRSVEFKEPDGGIPRKIDIERGTYISVGVGGPF